MKLSFRRLIPLAIIFALVAVSGCSHHRGHSLTPPTVGQQLVDLKAAHEQGAISEAEYNKLRDHILSSPKSCPHAKKFMKHGKKGCCAKAACGKDGKCPYSKKGAKSCGSAECPKKDCPGKSDGKCPLGDTSND